MKLKVGVIVPSRNGGDIWKSSAHAIFKQNYKFDSILVIDSESDDSTIAIAEKYGFKVEKILAKDFNHGGTRNLAVSLVGDVDILIFLTQDAVLDSADSISNILKYFDDPNISAVCGRQLPHFDANLLAQHARSFNYGEVTQIKDISSIKKLGIKTVFMSNSFSAYKKEVFDKLGGFPNNTILGEDMYISAKMILNGYKVVYSAEASVRHSHNYSPIDEFKRYFDTGVFHANEPWIMDSFGKANGEGKKFVLSELKFLAKENLSLIPKAIVTTLCKYLGYKLGTQYKLLPRIVCIKFSMYKSYWNLN